MSAPSDLSRRVLTLEGGRNFRDLGGYPTEDGRRVKWGVLFRSGSLAHLTPADHQTLQALAIAMVCDLRTSAERTHEPNRWCEIAEIAYWARDYEASFGELHKLLSSRIATPEQARQAMADSYRILPFEQAPSYAEVFARLAQGHVPMVFNCSAGKDRAGTAAALILSALGVARETVIEDYLLTNQTLNRAVFVARDPNDGREASLSNEAMDVAAVVLAADALYIESALEAIDAQHGDVAGYLRDALGMSGEALETMRANLLED